MLDAGIYALAVLLVATPVLVAAYVLRTMLSVQLRWFPLNGVHDGPVSYVLPIVALSALSIGYIILLTRAEVRETLSAPFLKAARGRGYTTARLLTRARDASVADPGDRVHRGQHRRSCSSA